ncbi:hypothetical protein D3C75_882960 [compost metagenome]
MGDKVDDPPDGEIDDRCGCGRIVHLQLMFHFSEKIPALMDALFVDIHKNLLELLVPGSQNVEIGLQKVKLVVSLQNQQYYPPE